MKGKVLGMCLWSSDEPFAARSDLCYLAFYIPPLAVHRQVTRIFIWSTAWAYGWLRGVMWWKQGGALGCLEEMKVRAGGVRV